MDVIKQILDKKEGFIVSMENPAEPLVQVPGIGRFKMSQVQKRAEEDLKAIANFLKNKQYSAVFYALDKTFPYVKTLYDVDKEMNSPQYKKKLLEMKK